MSILKKIQSEIARNGYELTSRESVLWLRKKIRELNLKPRTLIKDTDRLRMMNFVGKMYFFFYDPKTKQQLPYYDIFPLVIPLERYSDGFLGLNLHYVEPKIRIRILEALEKNLTNDKMTDGTRMKVNYNIITNISRARYMKPCIKRYLSNHINSRFLLISPTEWHLAAMLPFEVFRKERKKVVFAESREQYQ